jgi:hypothetical protein
MNAVRDMYNKTFVEPKTKKPDLTMVKDKTNQDYKLADGRWVSKDYLNEKLAYFYENGGPIMDV